MNREEKLTYAIGQIDEKYINDGYSIFGNCADTKWICFEIPRDSYKCLKILRHDLILEDAYKNAQTISTISLKELMKEGEKSEKRF